jgi:hypothetical protein
MQVGKAGLWKNAAVRRRCRMRASLNGLTALGLESLLLREAVTA